MVILLLTVIGAQNMSEASARTLAWREEKRKAGFQPLTIWVKADVKHRLEDLAFLRRKDLGEIVTEALNAWQPASAGRGTRTDDTRIRELIRAELAALHHQGQSPSLPERTPDTATTRTAATPPPAKHTILVRIHELSTQGLSQRKIAETLQREGITTLTGYGKWRGGTVSKLQAQIKANPGLLTPDSQTSDTPEDSV
jgi:hypothetical protein